MGRTLAIDLGTANTLVWSRGQGIVLAEPTVVAIDARRGTVKAMGEEAYAVVRRAGGELLADRPLRGGAVNDYQTTTQLLRMVLRRVGATRFNRPRVLICVPSASTDVERRAVQEAARRAGAASCYLMEEPMAAAIGADLPVQEPQGSLVVDIGGGTAEVAVLSLGGVVTSTGIRVGGFDMDAAIQLYVRDAHGVAIGDRTAEELKVALGSAFPRSEELVAEVSGRELESGLPQTVRLHSGEVREALAEPVRQVVAAVLAALSECPPELSQDVLRTGLHLTGGGSLLHGLDARLAHEAQVEVRHVPNPLQAVVRGAGLTVETIDDLSVLEPRA